MSVDLFKKDGHLINTLILIVSKLITKNQLHI